jgi:Holliday junction resolvase RusA-like endonuclease
VAQLVKTPPLSVNRVYTGKRYKTEEYRVYSQVVKILLKPMDIPKGDLEISLVFGVSNMGMDVDNGVKPFIDILQEVYGFNDKRIIRATIEKVKVEKGEGFIWFDIQKAKPSEWSSGE